MLHVLDAIWFSLDLSPPVCTLFNAHALNNSKVHLIAKVYGIVA